MIDGKLSEEHELAFASSDACHRLGASLSIDAAERVELESAAAAARQWALPPDAAQRLRDSTDTAGDAGLNLSSWSR